MDQKPGKVLTKDFVLLWQGQFVSQVGSQAFAIAMLFWTKHVSGSATLMGMLLMVSMLPGVLLGPFGGTLADHYSRKKILLVCDFILGLSVTAFAVLFFVMPEATDVIMPAMFAASVLVGIVKAFFSPAVTASIPDIAPKDQLTAANSLIQSSSQVALLIGQGAGGLLFRLLGAPLLFLIDGLSYLVSAAATLFITIPQSIPEKSKDWSTRFRTFWEDTVEGLRYIWQNPALKITFVSSSVLNFFVAPVFVILPFYVEDYLKIAVDWYGYLIIIFGIGMIFGYGLAGVLKVKGTVRSVLVSLSFILFGTMIALMGVVETLPGVIAVVSGCGVFMGYVNVNIMSILQLTTDAEIRGRVFGNLTTLTSAIMPVAFGLSGVAIDLLNRRVDHMLILCGGLMVLLSALMAFNRHFIGFFSHEAPAVAKKSEPEEAEAVLSN